SEWLPWRLLLARRPGNNCVPVIHDKKRVVVILHDAMNTIAPKSILGGQRSEAAALEPAKPAIRSGPKRMILVEPKVVDMALAKPLRGPIRFADVTVLEVHDTALIETKPQAATHGVQDEWACGILMSECGPRNLLYLVSWRQLHETNVLVDHPKIAGGVLGD